MACAQVANARLPFINNVPLVLSRAELAVMKQMKLFEDEESGARMPFLRCAWLSPHQCALWMYFGMSCLRPK